MTLKNGLLILCITSGSSLISTRAGSVIFPDQEIANAPSDDENADAVSSFGTFDQQQKRKKENKPPRILNPIAEGSFSTDPGRAASTAPGTASRSPAGLAEQAPGGNVISTSKKAVARHAQQSKSFQEVAVIANDLGFFPSTLFLTQGIPVRLYITGASVKSQCFMLDQFGVRRQIRNQKIEEVTFTPEQSGTFSFSCPMNGAKGTVVVKEIEVGDAKERMPASLQVSHSGSASRMADGVPIPKDKAPDIHDEDFTPEFRD